MKLRPLSNLKKKKTITSNRLEDDFIVTNYDFIVCDLRPIPSNPEAGFQIHGSQLLFITFYLTKA